MKDKRNHLAKKKKVLVLCPHPGRHGGVINYCNSILKYYESNSFTLEQFTIGRRPGKNSNLNYLITVFYDYIRFFFLLYNNDYALIHLNPSLGIIAVLRDSGFLLIAKYHSKKILVFWHGWGLKFESLIDNNLVVLKLVRMFFNKVDTFIVLASSFKKKLRDWGFFQKIIVDTTTFDDNLIKGFTPEKKIKEIKNSGKLKVLFLGRLEIEKGIIDTIDAFSELNQMDREVELVIAGDGPALGLVKKRVMEYDTKRIKLIGYVTGDKKREILENSHLLCLPTYYGEGLPVSILEAMAFGMPIITRPVGGIPDHFTEGENGYYVPSLDSKSFSKLLKKIISDKEGLSRMAMINYKYANRCFPTSIVTKRLDNIYRNIVRGNEEYKL